MWSPICWRQGERSSTRKAEEVETSQDEERLVELEEKVAALRRRRAELNREVQRWKGERERFNDSARTLRMEALKHREERDQANQKMAEIKHRVESLRNEIAEKRRGVAELDARLRKGRRHLPPRQDAEERLRRIEWEMMTTPTTDILEREEALIGEARGLREALAAHSELEAREDERLVMLAEVKATELEIRNCRDELSSLHETSEVNHEKMILLYTRADEEQRHGDKAHSKFMEYLSEVRAVDEELSDVIGEARRLRESLRESERRVADEREREIEARKRELLLEVKRKLEAGERLSLDELKLLYEEEEGEAKPQDELASE